MAAHRLDEWIEGAQFKGWDPFDALNSPLLKFLTGSNRRLGQLWVQLLKRSPVNLRPLLGIRPGYNPKGMGLFLGTYWRKYLRSGRASHLARARFFAGWLWDNAAPGYSGACWGYNFDWPNRGFFAPAGTPTIVNTAFIGLAFIDLLAAPQPGQQAVWDTARVLATAQSACDFILTDLQVETPAPGELCFSYTPLDRRFIHNANVMGAWLLAEVAARTGEPELAVAALAAARYTANRQQGNGSWRYGEGAADNWVDNFHTGFVLLALRRVGQALGTPEFDAALQRGYDFWLERFFTPSGMPKYYPSQSYPVDIHSTAQAVLTFLCYADVDPRAAWLARHVALWAVENMLAPEGYFHYQIHRRYRIRIPYMRWSQAWMQRALTELEGQFRHENMD